MFAGWARCVGFLRTARRPARAGRRTAIYFTDRGIEELEERRGIEEVSIAWLATRMRAFVDQNPEFDNAVDRLATFLARDDADES